MLYCILLRQYILALSEWGTFVIVDPLRQGCEGSLLGWDKDAVKTDTVSVLLESWIYAIQKKIKTRNPTLYIMMNWIRCNMLMQWQ